MRGKNNVGLVKLLVNTKGLHSMADIQEFYSMASKRSLLRALQ